MALFEVQGPDGRVLDVEAANEQEAIAKAKAQQGSRRTSLNDTLSRIDSMNTAPADTQRQPDAQRGHLPPVDMGGAGTQLGRIGLGFMFPAATARNYLRGADATTKNDANYLGQEFKRGVATMAGMPVDATTNLINLGIAGAGGLYGAITGSSNLPELIHDPVGGSGTFERLFQVNDEVKPSSKGVKVAGRFVRDLGSASLPAGAIASRMPKPGTSLGVQAGLSGLASAGGETGRFIAPAGYENTLDLTGTMVSGIAVPAMIANRVEAINNLRDATKPNKVNAFADRYVNDQIEHDVRLYPGAAKNLDDAMQVEKNINGVLYRVGQASGVPSLLDMERRVATSGPEQFNRRAMQDQQQQAAIMKHAEDNLPLLSGKNDIPDRLKVAQTDRANLADALPVSQADEVGQTLRAARTSLKGRADQEVAKLFAAPVEEAERLRVMLDSKPLLEKTSQILSNPILQFDATNAPAVARKIAEISQARGTTGSAPTLVNAEGRPIYEARDHASRISFADLKAAREAVMQDIARERGSAHPNARQRLRALYEVRDTIDDVAQQAPKSVTDKWNAAREHYAKDYSPKFLRGINLRQSLRDVTGEMKIPDEKLAGQYFKPWSSTPMDRFLSLYGDSPQARHAMESHILDTYRRSVVKDGVIDPAKHESFMRNYDAPLKKLPELQDRFKSLASASNILAQREAELIKAQKVISQGELNALKYENLPEAGIDPRKVNAFLNKHGDDFQESVSAIYGKKAADDHMKNLREIAKASEIADRGRLSDAATPQQGLSPLSLQKTAGFSGRTVFSMIRAVTTGRTSPHDMAYTLGAQFGSHRVGQALIAAEERAISDPETAKLIAQAMKQPATSPAGQVTLKNILAKGGYYLVGGNKYPEMTRYRATPFAIQANEQDE